MKKKLSFEITGIVSLIFIICVIGALLTNHFFKTEVLSQQQHQLEREIQLLDQELDLSKVLKKSELSASEKKYLATFIGSSDERLTLLNKNFSIIYDTESQKHGDITGSRESRPEIQAIEKGAKIGVSLRKSLTLNEDLLYVAVPIREKGELIGVVRISERFAGFSSSLKRFRLILFLFILTLFIILVVLVIQILRQKNRPLQTLLPTLKNMLEHPEKQSLILKESSEWQELYELVNQLTNELNRTYLAYTSNEEKFQYLLEDLQIGVFSIDSQNRISLINPKMKEMLHFADDFQLEDPYYTVIQNPQLLRFIQQGLKTHNSLHEEIYFTRPQERYLDFSIRYFESSQATETQLLGIAYDLTAIRQLEKMQQDFVSNVSHELKTPVTSLIGFTETLLDGAKEDPEILNQFLEIMQKDAHRLQVLIQQILQLSRSGTMEDSDGLTPLFPAQIIEDTLHSYHPKINQKELQVQLNLDPTLEITTYLNLFQPIIKNLIENAINYNHQKGQLNISLTQAGTDFVIQVQDTGIGIAEDDQKRIFERFYRVDKARARNSGGTGLGLAIVMHYSQFLQGELSLESQLGVGTTFSIRFPIALRT